MGRELPLAVEVQRRAPARLGMSRRRELRCGGARVASLCTLAGLAVLGAGSGSEAARAPGRLVDGSVAPAVPAALRAHGLLVTTRVRLVRAGRIGGLVAECVPGDRVPPGRLVVERVGLSGVSITFLGLASAVDGCDHAPHGIPRPWCGRAAWPLRRRRVSDPRLAICQDARGRSLVAFGWVNPGPRTKWIVEDQPGADEIYPVAGRLPVRVATVAGIVRGRATFRYAEYDARGVMLAKRTITPAIAG